MFKFSDNAFHQTYQGVKKTWSIPELLEAYNPLPGEPIKERNEAIRQIIPLAEELYSELSEAARLRYDFWKNLQPQRIQEQHFKYTTKVTNSYLWELKVNSEGLFFKDVSGDYGHPNRVYEQLFSDFWFFGPLMPLPDLATRKQVVANIRNAFLQAGGPASYQHFELFEYPTLPDEILKWEEGDHSASDFVIVRSFGIEHGAQNWHDGLTYLGFLSFEHFLTLPPVEAKVITPKIRKELQRFLTKNGAATQVPAEPNNEVSKQLFMDNGGNVLYIHRDGFGDVYRATYAEEAAWRKELVQNSSIRLYSEDNESVLKSLVETLQYNGVVNVESLLFEVGERASLKARQAIAKLLVEQFKSEKGAEILLTFFNFEDEDNYWRDYVFRTMYQLRDSKVVQKWIVKCLRGDNEAFFKKAVDVLQMWGYYGDKAFTDIELLRALNWQDACAADPDFNKALDKVIRLTTGG